MGGAARLVIYIFSPVQQTTSGNWPPCKVFFRVGNQECEKLKTTSPSETWFWGIYLMLLLLNECGRVFPAVVGSDSPSREIAN